MLLGFVKVYRTRRRYSTSMLPRPVNPGLTISRVRQAIAAALIRRHNPSSNSILLRQHDVDRDHLFGIRALEAGVHGSVVQASAIPRQSSIMRQQRLNRAQISNAATEAQIKNLERSRTPDKRWLDGNAVGFDQNHFTDVRDLGIVPLTPRNTSKPEITRPAIPASRLHPPGPPRGSDAMPRAWRSSSLRHEGHKIYSLPPPPRLPAFRRRRLKSWPVVITFTPLETRDLILRQGSDATVIHDPFWTKNASLSSEASDQISSGPSRTNSYIISDVSSRLSSEEHLDLRDSRYSPGQSIADTEKYHDDTSKSGFSGLSPTQSIWYLANATRLSYPFSWSRAEIFGNRAYANTPPFPSARILGVEQSF